MGTRQQKNLKASAWPLNFASSAPWLAHHHLHIKIPLQNEKMTRSSQCILLCTKPLIEIWVFLAAYWKVPLWTHWLNMEKGGIFCSSKSLNGTRGHFSCLLLENILLMVLPPFFTPSCFLQKDGGSERHPPCLLQKSSMTSIDGKSPFDKWLLIPDNMFHNTLYLELERWTSWNCNFL